MSNAKQNSYESLAILSAILRFFAFAAVLLCFAGIVLLVISAGNSKADFLIMVMPATALLLVGLFQALLYFSGAALLDAIRNMAINSQLILDEAKLTNQLLAAANTNKESAPSPEPAHPSGTMARMHEFEIFGKLSSGQMRTYKVLAKTEDEARDTAFSDGIVEVHNIRRL